MVDMIDPSTDIKLTPSPAGRKCLGNGTWLGYECCCDECDYFLECFPEVDLAGIEDLRKIYDMARSLPYVNALNLIRQAQTEEERNFWAYVADMNLQRLQQAAIENHLF